MTQYQFGDQDLAARRLEEVARVFEPTTREFLRGASARQLRLAVDLGCGPGFTTRLLAETLSCEGVAGLDTSERFLALAHRTGTDRSRFHRHDVTSTPFPEAPADLLYCRFLLSHLPDPDSCLEKWATQLAPNGLLLIEEVEAIEATQPVFERYLHIVDSMLKGQGTGLYVGPIIEHWKDRPTLRKRQSRAQRFSVANQDAATMFSMNVPNWKDRPFIRENYSADSIASLEAELKDLARTGGKGSITWTLRQIVCERPA